MQDHARRAADLAETQRAKKAEEACHLAAELAQHPDARLLVVILADPRDHSYLEHAIPVARDYRAGQTAPSGAQPAESTALWLILARLGRGMEKEYAKDPQPIGEGGQGSVRGAVHKPTGGRRRRSRRGRVRRGLWPLGNCLSLLVAVACRDWLVVARCHEGHRLGA